MEIKSTYLVLSVFVVVILDVPFTNGTYIHGTDAFSSIRKNSIISDASMNNSNESFLVSTNLKEQIQSHLK